MELLLKVGGSQDLKHWQDGQIADIRPDGFHKGNLTRTHHCILTLPGDYWQLRGTTNWKWPGQKAYNNIKKYLVAVDSQGKYPWERTIELDEKRIRRRDWFFDYKLLLDLGLITHSQFEAIYNKKKDPGLIYIDRAFDQIIRHEDQHKRLSSKYALSKGTVSTGTYSIGSGLNYDTVTAFELDIITPGEGPLTGNLTGEHNNEETAISSTVVFAVDTATYLLKITAQSGDEHNGGAYGNGARISLGTFDGIQLNDSALANCEISKLAFDGDGGGNGPVNIWIVEDTNGAGTIKVNRCLIKGNADTPYGIRNPQANGAAIVITNNIVYGIGDGAADYGIGLLSGWKGGTWYVCNNTVVKCYNNIYQDSASSNETITAKNNLCQADTGGNDYKDDGAGFGTTGHNVSEDDTSPDAAYDNTDVHTNSVFKNYAADDYRLDSAGDATNLAILDDGEDLSGTFTDDIEGQTRSTWYIGASEILAAGWTGKVLGVNNPAKVIGVSNPAKVNGV